MSATTTTTKYLDLKHQLGFYGAYHSTPGNILVHVVLVPVLFLTFQGLLSTYLPPPASLAPLSCDLGHLGSWGLRFELGGGTALAALYELYYLALDVPLALMYLPILVLLNLLASALAQDRQNVWPMVLANGGSWLAQILSHRFIEGGAPALVDNLIGALVLAPFFTFIELVLHLTPYRSALARDITNAAGVYQRELRAGRKARL